jgi:hypothetical protein
MNEWHLFLLVNGVILIPAKSLLLNRLARSGRYLLFDCGHAIMLIVYIDFFNITTFNKWSKP